MLVNFNYLLKKAIKDNYGVGAIEAWDIQTLKAIVETATEERSPIGILVGQEVLEKNGLEHFTALALSFINGTEIPIALCLDECSNFDFILKCIKAGFSFVMFEPGPSEYGNNKIISFEENIFITKKITEIAHISNVTVEASLGEMPLSKKGYTRDLEIEGTFTDPDKAYRFVKETNIDILAPSIGNIHCLYKDKWPEPDWNLAKTIVDKIGIPCALHGASGATNEQINKAISVGFRKINIGTKFNEIYRVALIEELQKCAGLNCPINASIIASNKIKEELRCIIKYAFKSSNRFTVDPENYWTKDRDSESVEQKLDNTHINRIIREITKNIKEEYS